MKKFIILTTQRTGSSVIRILLNKHSQINSHGEVLLPHYSSPDGFNVFMKTQNPSLNTSLKCYSRDKYLVKKLRLDLFKQEEYGYFLESLFTNPEHAAPWSDPENRFEYLTKSLQTKANGLKVMYSTLNECPNLLSYLVNQSDIYVIHLYRRNLLKSFVSVKRLEAFRQTYTKEVSESRKPIKLNIDEMFDFFNKKETERKVFEGMFASRDFYTELSYEEFCEDNSSIILKIHNFLNVTSEQPPPSNLKKMSSDIIANEITNWKDVVDSIKHNNYEYFLQNYEI